MRIKLFGIFLTILASSCVVNRGLDCGDAGVHLVCDHSIMIPVCEETCGPSGDFDSPDAGE